MLLIPDGFWQTNTPLDTFVIFTVPRPIATTFSQTVLQEVLWQVVAAAGVFNRGN